VIRAVARWADLAPSQVAIVSGAAARHKLVQIDREDALPAPAVCPAHRRGRDPGKRTPES
jgi:uncharacterized protein YggU (UPF0235/DUF167 family)